MTDPEKADTGGRPGNGRAPSLKRSSRMNSHEFETVRPDQKVLTPDEKLFLLNVERGDVPAVKRIVTALTHKRNIFDINCVDPLGRSALVIAIENENLELMGYLLDAGIELRDGLLIAIREDYVDGVDCLLRFEEENHKAGTPYSWEAIDQVTANFTPDITPLILAAQRNNYEILKMLLDRGATIPMPHDVKCSCDDCVEESANDSLRFSLSRINAYKALASPSLIALSSKDPILTAFELSNELKHLSVMESQFREDFSTLRKQTQDLATGLVDHARTSYELEVLLNHNPDGDPWIPGEFQTLHRLQRAIDSNQKRFVTHPSVQQLLAAIWYEGLPGFRRMNFVRQFLCVLKNACMFPVYSLMFILAPHSRLGKLAGKPFVKFISNSASYMLFLTLLALASQRVEYVVIDLLVFLFPDTIVTNFLAEVKDEWIKHERGSLPTIVEIGVILWVQGLVLKEVLAIFREGLFNYLTDMWNLADLISYGAFLNWIGLRILSFLLVQKELWEGIPPEEVYIPRSQWKPFDPHLLAEGMFGAGMISSFLKLVHIFSINPHLGPLQVSLGKMVIDIAKFLVLYILVLFSFACGLNKLLWYYADLEKQNCYSLPGGLPDWDNYGDSCVAWRRFANLWESSQSLFWASFGLVELGDFELEGIKSFTRFWGLLMFGSYSVCNIIVLLNMLIAMMSNSYTLISDRSDMEWKFARSKLWISYFSKGDEVAVPFNMIPTPRNIQHMFRICCPKKQNAKEIEDEKKRADSRYYGVVRCLVRRYITAEQRKSEDFHITEDDINEVRQDIRSFRYELINILRMNDMKTPHVKDDSGVIGRRSKDLERMIQKGFNLSKIEGVMENVFASALKQGDRRGIDLFKGLAKAVVRRDKRDWNEAVRQSSVQSDPIGSTATSIKRRNQSFKRSLLARGNSRDDIDRALVQMNSEQLVSYNPLLEEYTPATRIAYARFKSKLQKIDEPAEEENSGASAKRDNTRNSSFYGDKQLSVEPTKTIATSPFKPGQIEAVATQASQLRSKLEVTADAGKSPTKSSTPEPVEPEKSSPPAESTAKESKPDISPTQPVETVKIDISPAPEPKSSSQDSPEKEPEPVKSSPRKSPEPAREKTPKKSPAKATDEVDVEQKLKAIQKPTSGGGQTATPTERGEPCTFDPKGKSISTGRNVGGWL